MEYGVLFAHTFFVRFLVLCANCYSSEHPRIFKRIVGQIYCLFFRTGIIDYKLIIYILYIYRLFLFKRLNDYLS